MKEDFWLTEFEHFPELQTFGVCLLDSFSAFVVLPPLLMSVFLSFHWTRICSGCYTQEVSQLCCAVDSFDFNDAANLGHVPPFVLLHHYYKVHRPNTTESLRNLFRCINHDSFHRINNSAVFEHYCKTAL